MHYEVGDVVRLIDKIDAYSISTLKDTNANFEVIEKSFCTSGNWYVGISADHLKRNILGVRVWYLREDYIEMSCIPNNNKTLANGFFD